MNARFDEYELRRFKTSAGIVGWDVYGWNLELGVYLDTFFDNGEARRFVKRHKKGELEA